MPLTAFDPETGQVVLATWPVSSPQCKDPTCRAKLHLVRGTQARVQHFRHSTRSACRSMDPIREREAMSPWHLWWQSQADDAARIEVTDVNASGDVRRADIVTGFGWCLEVQHSPIAAKTVRARENHWNGRVLWLVDAASDDRQADFSIDARWARLDGTWVHHLGTLVAVDDGDSVWLFPASVMRSAGEIRSSAAYMRRFDRADFVQTWINAHTAPFAGEPQTKWRKDALERVARSRADSQLREQLAHARALREQRQTEIVCEYQGPRTNLIHEQPAAPVTLPPPVAPQPQPQRRVDVVVDLRDTSPITTEPMVITWRKTDASRHPVTKLPAHSNRGLACRDCARILEHSGGRLKCDAYWTPSTSTDINPAWAACSVWRPKREEQ